MRTEEHWTMRAQQSRSVVELRVWYATVVCRRRRMIFDANVLRRVSDNRYIRERNAGDISLQRGRQHRWTIQCRDVGEGDVTHLRIRLAYLEERVPVFEADVLETIVSVKTIAIWIGP